jgi:uncharacterized protein YkwD
MFAAAFRACLHNYYPYPFKRKNRIFMKLRLRRFSKILVSIIFVTVIISSCKKDDETAVSPYSQIENDILQLVNQHRASLGKGTLAMNDIIYKQCKDHSTYMASVDSMNHKGDTIRANNIFTTFGGTNVGENVAYGYSSAQLVVTAWLNSDGHRKNIEGDYNYTGISVVKNSKGVNYFTQIFVKK